MAQSAIVSAEVSPSAAQGGVSRRLVGAAAFALALFALLVLAGSKLLNDPDTWWHIEVGRQIWATGAFPTTDALSHTFAGENWIAKEWLSQVILFAAYDAGGWLGVVALTAAIAGASFGFILFWLSARLELGVATALSGLAALLAAPQLLARPHVFMFALAAAWMAGLIGAKDNRPPWWLVPVLVLWANLHASFPIAVAIAALFGLSAVFSAGPGARARVLAQWSGFGLASMLALGATPYGYGSLLVTLQLFGGGGTLPFLNDSLLSSLNLMGGAEALPFIREWQPLGLDPVGLVAWGVLATVAALIVTDGRRDWFHLLAVALIAYLMIRHARFSGLFGVVAMMLMADPLARRLAPATRRAAAGVSGPGSTFSLAALGMSLVAAVSVLVVAEPRPNPAMAPEKALAAARAHGLAGPVFNAYDFGGFLIAHGVATFIDGRNDQLFLNGFMADVLTLPKDETSPRFVDFVEARGAAWALVRTESREDRRFDEAEDWMLVHRDPIAVVYERRRD